MKWKYTVSPPATYVQKCTQQQKWQKRENVGEFGKYGENDNFATIANKAKHKAVTETHKSWRIWHPRRPRGRSRRKGKSKRAKEEKHSSARRAPGDTFLPDQFQTVEVILNSDWCQKFFVFFCPIRGQHFREAFHPALVFSYCSILRYKF